MLLELEKVVSISLNVTQTDGIVLARSAFHHSLNYHSVTLFGEAVLVTNDDKPDYQLPIWAGVIPLNTVVGNPIADSVLNENIPLPEGVKKMLNNKL